MLNLIQDLPNHIQEASTIFKDSNISKLNGIDN